MKISLERSISTMRCYLLLFTITTVTFATDEPVCGTEPSQCLAVPEDCRLVMAESSLPSAGWGVFSLVDRKRGTPILEGDLVVQVADINMTYAAAMSHIIHDYLWSAEETGGFYEGIKVMSMQFGIGMLANGMRDSNVLPWVPTVDEGGLTRLKSPGAGAITHYHNYTYFASKDIQAGEEIRVNYGPDWIQERQATLVPNMDGIDPRSVDWLRQNGRCLDNLRPGRSSIENAGRGAFATRNLSAGSLVAPVPMLVIGDRRVMDMVRMREDRTLVETKQLLVNYCFGDDHSSLLLCPYGPMVSLVNHGGSKAANARLQWADPKTAELSMDEVQTRKTPLLLEMVAMRDITPGEEVVLDYGRAWTEAWLSHVHNWEPPSDAQLYAPSFVHDDAVRSLRTAEELKKHPYPDNIFTSCFYSFTEHAEQAKSNTGSAVTTVPWKQSRGIYELRNLRPCQVLKRSQHKKLGTLFTVQMRNRYGLEPNERIPNGATVIVTGVPRTAIRFSDKIYTTDQHLPKAFRHSLGLPVFPEQWKDLLID